MMRKNSIEKYPKVALRESYRQIFRTAGERSPYCRPINPGRKTDSTVEPQNSVGAVAVFLVLIAIGVGGIWFLMVWQVFARLREIYPSF
jgi:hypothetical protein